MFKLAAVMGVELTKVEPPVGWLEMVIEQLLSVSTRQEGKCVKGRESPARLPAPDQHEESDFLAARGKTVSNNDNKASRVKSTAEVKEEHTKRMARKRGS
jgi:hypothetical protein